MTRQIARASVRLVAFCVALWVAALDFVGLTISSRGKLTTVERAAWLHRWSRKLLSGWGITVQCEGRFPQSGLIVSNHLSYLDVLLFSSVAPCTFVAKSEVRNWPVVGMAARTAGAIFVERSRIQGARVANGQLEHSLRDGIPVVLFAEGTSSGGSSVLPFRSPMIEPAVRLGAVVTPACISYGLEDGSVERDICYWGDMVLVPHLLKLLTKERIHGRVCFGEPIEGYVGRKQAAALARQSVVRLLQ